MHTRIKAGIIEIIFLLTFVFFLASGCGKKLPEDKQIGVNSLVLLNQDSSQVVFPEGYKGKILVMSFIYTNCPDICPLTTHNMKLIQEQIKKDGIKDVQFVELSFDPERDTPSVLKEFGDIRNIDYKNFTFLTGKKSTVKSILNNMNVLALKGDTTITESGKPVYFFTHTDRITLIDQNGIIRNEYRGSKANISQIVNDIKILGD